jgi:hypothetical protein
MASSEHLPGCDLRHGSRQRCTSPKAAPDSNTPAIGVSAVASRSVRFRLFIVVLGVVGILAIAAVAIVSTHSEPTPLYRNAHFPEWARPAGSVELRNSDTCTGESPWWPPCRRIEFGTNRTIEEVVDELRPRFKSHGWSVGVEPHDWSLHARLPFDLKCIVIYPATDAERLNVPRQSEFMLVVGVVVDQCGAG